MQDYLNLSNVESDAMAIGETVRKIENHAEYRYENRERTANGIFLVIDEFAALRIALDKKEFAEINDSEAAENSNQDSPCPSCHGI